MLLTTAIRCLKQAEQVDVLLQGFVLHIRVSAIGQQYLHQAINHAQGQYVIDLVHANTIEGFWSTVKRGIVGTLDKVSKKYVHLYVKEFEFRYNQRPKGTS